MVESLVVISLSCQVDICMMVLFFMVTDATEMVAAAAMQN